MTLACSSPQSKHGNYRRCQSASGLASVINPAHRTQDIRREHTCRGAKSSPSSPACCSISESILCRRLLFLPTSVSSAPRSSSLLPNILATIARVVPSGRLAKGRRVIFLCKTTGADEMNVSLQQLSQKRHERQMSGFWNSSALESDKKVFSLDDCRDSRTLKSNTGRLPGAEEAKIQLSRMNYSSKTW